VLLHRVYSVDGDGDGDMSTVDAEDAAESDLDREYPRVCDHCAELADPGVRA
jgi:hypothetical protein